MFKQPILPVKSHIQNLLFTTSEIQNEVSQLFRDLQILRANLEHMVFKKKQEDQKMNEQICKSIRESRINWSHNFKEHQEYLKLEKQKLGKMVYEQEDIEMNQQSIQNMVGSIQEAIGL